MPINGEISMYDAQKKKTQIQLHENLETKCECGRLS